MTDNNQPASTKHIPGCSAQLSLKASHIPRPHTSKCTLQDHYASEPVHDINTSRSKQPTRTAKKSNITGPSHIPVPRTSRSNKNSNIPRPSNTKNTKISPITRPSPHNTMKDMTTSTEPPQPTIAVNCCQTTSKP